MSEKSVLKNADYLVFIEEGGSAINAINLAGHAPDYTMDCLDKVVTIQIVSESTSKEIQILCNCMSEIKHCAILEENKLIILLNEQLFQINLQSGDIYAYKQLDILGCNFGIYAAPCGYVIHGEIDIIGLNRELNEIWRFSGWDIFVSISGKEAFVQNNHSIQLYDFWDNFYEIDYNGHIIKEKVN